MGTADIYAWVELSKSAQEPFSQGEHNDDWKEIRGMYSPAPLRERRRLIHVTGFLVSYRKRSPP
jgi:hypothetical protein